MWLHATGQGLVFALGLGTVVWLGSLWRHDLSVVDRFWSALVWGAGATMAAAWHGAWPQGLAALSPRGGWMLALAALWALRLGLYISWRNWGHGEDRRYTRMRDRNGPLFAYTSLFWVFGLQAVLACVVLQGLTHVFLAGRLGIGTRDVVLYPFWTSVRLTSISERPWQEIYISVAGPLTISFSVRES